MGMIELVGDRILRAAKEGWRGVAFRLVPDQPWKRRFPKLGAFKLALRFPGAATLCVDRSGRRPASIPNEEDVDWIVMSMECDE